MRPLLFALLLMYTLPTFAFNAPDSLDAAALEEMLYLQMYQEYLDSIDATVNYRTDVITLNNDLATLTVPTGYKYIGPADAEMVLVDIWGNPPSDVKSLGMLFPVESGVNDLSGYAINITYADEGHVADDDARDIDYDELLESLIEDTRTESEMREAQGYGTVEMIGWGSTPFYDETEKKLHWAMELKFDDSPDNTLNYSIRVLGREGYLVLNAIGGMELLPEIKQNINGILAGVEFQPGQRYADYKPGVDRLAAYGVGGLIAGKVLAKTGVLAAIGLFLAKAWKLILVGLVALSAGFRKLFGRGSE